MVLTIWGSDELLKKRNSLLTYLSGVIWSYPNDCGVSLDFGALLDVLPDSEKDVANILIDFHRKLYAAMQIAIREVEESGMGAVPFTVPLSFHKVVSQETEQIVLNIERKQQYNLLIRLYYRAEALHTFQQVQWPLLLVQIIQVLLGEENRLLVGMRGGRPVFKSVSPFQDSLEGINTFTSTFFGGSNLDVIGQEDVHMVPDPKETSRDALYGVWPQLKSTKVLSDILCDAYYNQYYVLHPQGAYVAFTGGDPRITGITIKLKPALKDRNYHDFIFRVHLVDGDVLMVLPGVVATGQVATAEEITGESVEYGFFHMLGVQIYHDLVTARHLPGVRREQNGVDRKPSDTKLQLSEPSYRYIPRIAQVGRSNQPAAREALTSPRVSEPHTVSGHPRTGNMTEEQRKRIIVFEEETGFKVLENLPEGKTWVRPHISPASDSNAVLQLPKFIRARIQADLTKRLRGE